MTRPLLIAGNWKMNKTVGEGTQFVADLNTAIEGVKTKAFQIALFPSFVSLKPLADKVSELNAPVIIDAQTMESKLDGAYTGEISAPMLNDINIKWVVLGHSERRQYYNETSETVGEKAVAAIQNNITPVVCVGELLEEREAGSTDDVIKTQVLAAIQNVDASDFDKLVFAYEPVWAIGTGKTCDAAEANRVCGVIREILNTKGDGNAIQILYGGSVKPSNSEELLGQSDIDGALIGGASLKVDDFSAIIKTAAVLSQNTTQQPVGV